MAKPKNIEMDALITPAQTGVPVTFQLSGPSFPLQSKVVPTDAAGHSKAMFSLGNKYKTGVYQGKILATVGGAAISDNTSITVT